MDNKKIKNNLINFFFPIDLRCIICGEELSNDIPICNACFNKLPIIPDKNICEICGEKTNEQTLVCLNCKNMDRYFTKAYSVFYYIEPIYSLMLSFKFNNKKYLGNIFSKILYKKFVELNLNIDCIIPVPITSTSLKKRGFNQAQLLTEEFERNGIEILNNILSRKNNSQQALLNYSQRIENLKTAFTLNDKKNIKNKSILIIDDIYTTGATANSISKTLMENGAKKVFVLTVAHSLKY